MNKTFFSASLRLFGLILFFTFSGFAQKSVPEPKDVLGFTPGDDYKLASWAKIVEYFQRLDESSDRVIFKEIGKTTEGKPFTYAVISSPANLKKLDYYKQINNKLADSRMIKRSDKQAEKLIKRGKTFVLITHGIHSTEVGSTLSSTLTAHKLATSNDAEIKKILDETIVVIVPSLNPDGVDIVKNWYDKTLETKFEGTSPPELYQKYVGHDNNRDWYAFTQVETQLTVEKIHNVYHPQIVHDIHQQGSNGARLFLPPYEPPVEPNVPQEIIEGYTEIGTFMAKELRKKGFQGITTNTTYDAWTPARAYSHYHGGVRILSETASANLASPIEVKFDDLRKGRGFDSKVASENFSPVWKGGKWGMRDITNYMTNAAFQLMRHAAENRETWLKRFYKIGKNATRPRKDGELNAIILPFPEVSQENIPSEEYFRRNNLLEILERGNIELRVINEIQIDGIKYPESSVVIPMNQPYGDFAKALLLKQDYPNLIDTEKNPITPYDVTAHNLALLSDVTVQPIYKSSNFSELKVGRGFGRGGGCGCGAKNRYQAIYRSEIPSMDEGWTRWVIETERYLRTCCVEYPSIQSNLIKSGINKSYESIIFPDQSPNQILNGYREGSMPEEYTGGLEGKGVENLKKFVEDGGTLVFLNRSSEFAIEQFNLPVKDIAKDWKQKDFFIPGSILRTELDTSHPIAKDMPKESIAWFERSPVFEVTDESRVKVIAKYPSKAEEILLSGWALGKEKIAGKAALVEVEMGKGKIILFGFRPQYRGQSLATFPLLFNSISQ